MWKTPNRMAAAGPVNHPLSGGRVENVGPGGLPRLGEQRGHKVVTP